MRAQRLRVLLVILFGLQLAAASHAGLNRWTSSGPEGIAITALATDRSDPSVVYAATEASGVFRTSPGESRWEAVNAGLSDPAVAALAARDSVLFAGTANGRLFRSLNGGDQWSEIALPSKDAIRGIALGSELAIIHLATAQGLLTSRDHGETWTRSGISTGDSLGIATDGRGRVYVALRSYGVNVYQTANDGQTWEWLNGVGDVDVIAIDPIRSTLYAARDQFVVAVDPAMTRRVLPPLTFPVSALLAEGEDLYAGTADGIHLYREGDPAWRRIGSTTTEVRAMALASSPRRLYAGTRGGAFAAAEDSALHPINEGLSAAYTYAVESLTASRALAATPAGLFETTDGGESWFKRIDAEVVDVETNGSRAVYAAGSSGIHASADDGLTWERIMPSGPAAIAVASASPPTIYAAFATMLAKSTDDGRTWANSDAGLPSYYWYYGLSVAALETDDLAPATAYVAIDQTLYRTTNDGATWNWIYSTTRTDALRAVAARDPLIHVAQNRGVRTTLDAGGTWSPVSLAEEVVQALVIDPTDPARSYAGTASGRVYRTEQSGSEWHLFGEGLTGAPIHRLAINSAGDRIYAATSAGVFVYETTARFQIEHLPIDPLRLPRLLGDLVRGSETTRVRSDGTGFAAGFVLPAAGTVSGARGSLFRTDVTISNARSAAQEIVVAWLPQGNEAGAAVPMFRMTLPASSDDRGGTVTVVDLADELRIEGLGSLVMVAVNSSGDADREAAIDGVARIRSAAACGSGFVSQSFPAVPLVAGHSRSRALGLRHDAAYRTNFGIVNLGEARREFTVIVDGQRDAERLTVSVAPFSPLQMPLPDRHYGAVALTVISDGRAVPWVAYGSSVDNASGDSWSSVAVPIRGQ